MILRTSPTSPFVRLVLLAAHSLGLMDQITVEPSNPFDEKDSIREQNPLSKVPVLLVGGRAIFDSRVILDYFDRLHREKHGDSVLFPGQGMDDLQTHVDFALLQGMLEAGVMIVYEGRFRPEDKRLDSIVSWQRGKIERAFEPIGTSYVKYTNGKTPTAAEIALACSLDFFDFRDVVDWRAQAPHLEAWMGDFAASVAGYKDTLPPDIAPASWR